MTYKVNSNRLTTNSTSGIYYRLVALWALCEALLGGIIHGLRIPVSGITVGSCAVVCISLIAYYNPAKGSILKATLLVAIFKMMLSPQAPLPAYFAVFFQGLLGEALFWRRKFYPLVCILFAVLALLESGLQRIVVLTLVYGNDLWKAFNEFLNGLTGQSTRTNYSLWIAGAYVFLHLLVGLLVGYWAGKLPRQLDDMKNKYALPVPVENPANVHTANRKRFRKKGLIVIWLILLILYLQSEFGATPWLPAHISVRIFIRSIVIILTWYLLISPLMKSWLNNWLQKKQAGLRSEINVILGLLPKTESLMRSAWENSNSKKGIGRFILFGKIALVNSLTEPNPIYILTGGTGTGKTTSLLSWASNRKDVYGILSPVIDGKRFFMNVQTGERWPMETGENEGETLQVGRYVFSKSAFEKAISVLKIAMNEPGWLIIDELGPLEIREEGFYYIIKELLDKNNSQIILVVRDSIVNEIIQKFSIKNPEIVHSIEEL